MKNDLKVVKQDLKNYEDALICMEDYLQKSLRPNQSKSAKQSSWTPKCKSNDSVQNSKHAAYTNQHKFDSTCTGLNGEPSIQFLLTDN